MGAKQTKLNGQNVTHFNETSLENLKLNGDFNNGAKLRVKRRKSNNNGGLNRSSSSPVIAKWRFSGFFNDSTNNNSNLNQPKFNLTELNSEPKVIDSQQASSTTSSSNTNTSTHTSKSIQQSPEMEDFNKNVYSNHHTINNSNSLNEKNKVIELNQQLKSKQQTLTNIIKQNSSAQQPSYHLNSKLYRISSIKQTFQYNNATSISNYQNFPKINEQVSVNNRTKETTKNNHKISGQEVKSLNNNLKTSKSNNNLENSLKTPVASKIAKRLGLSPRFKRKIVETITNKVTSINNQNNTHQNNDQQQQQQQQQQQTYMNSNQKLNNQVFSLTIIKFKFVFVNLNKINFMYYFIARTQYFRKVGFFKRYNPNGICLQV
jgi:hypothetical protein